MSSQPFTPFQVTLPGHPDRELTPNQKARHGHWSQRSKPVAAARQEAATESRNQLGHTPPDCEGSTISLRVLMLYKKGEQTLDLDNAIAALKPYIDGIFDYLKDGGDLKVDDRQIEALSISRAQSEVSQTIYRFFDLRSLSDDSRDAF